MLVASELKGELARIHPARHCCRRAELAGLLFLRRRTGGVSTLEHATARVALQLAASLGIPAATSPGVPAAARGGRQLGSRHHLQVAVDPAPLADWAWTDAKACDQRAFVRGILLSASVSLGASGPHIEFVTDDARRARELVRRLRAVEVRPSLILRRGRSVVYVKGREQVGTLLRLAGANRALLDFESDRVARDVRNRLNRLINAEEANLGRTVRAAARQLQAIARLEATGALGELPDALRQTADQRRRHPDADLDALADALGVTRSAVNHRLRRLVALAAEQEPAAAPHARRGATGRGG